MVTKVQQSMIEGFDEVVETIPIVSYIKVPNYNPATSVPTVILQGSLTPSFGHRHFGGIVRTKAGRLIIAYRKSPSHGSQINTQTCYIMSDNNGADWTEEAILNASNSTRDQASALVGVSETGRIFIAWADIEANGGTVDATNPQLYKLKYSDDNGDTWSSSITIDAVPDSYARLFGSIKLAPSDQTSGANMLVITAYQRTATSPSNVYASTYYKSYDNGLTWSDPAYVINDTTGFNEHDMFYLNNDTILSVVRHSTGLNLFVSTNGGASFTNKGVVPNTVSDSYVAPSLDLFYVNSMPYALLGYCDRVEDKTIWRVAPVNNLVGSLGASAFINIQTTGTNDMVNASGYQRAIFYETGHVAFVEFKEYNSPDVYSDVRFWQFNPYRWARRYYDGKILLGVGADLTSNPRLNVQVDGATAPAIGTDTSSTSLRNHYVLSVNNVNTGYIGTDDPDFAIGIGSNAPSIYLQADGDVYFPTPYNALFGTATPLTSDATIHAVVQGSSISAITTNAATSSARNHIVFENSNGVVGSVSTSGTTTTYATSSDPRLKSEFEELTDEEVFEKISKLADCVGEFHFLADPEKKIIGFDAHKVVDAKIGSIGVEGRGPRDMPIGAVYGTEKRIKTVLEDVPTGEYDQHGNEIFNKIKKEVEYDAELKVSPAGVDPSKAVALLTLAVNALIKKVYR